MTFLLKHRRIVLALILLSAVCALLAGAYWDIPAWKEVTQHKALVAANDHWISIISDIADVPSLLWLLLILLAIFNERHTVLYGALALIGQASVCQLLKDIFKRVRPNGHTDSFPSGHAAAAFAIAVVLSLRHPKQRIYIFLIAALLATTRVILFKHYPSDVFAAAAIGMAIALLVEPLAKRLGALENHRRLRLLGTMALLSVLAFFCATSLQARKMTAVYIPVIVVLCIVKRIQQRRLARETQSINQP